MDGIGGTQEFPDRHHIRECFQPLLFAHETNEFIKEWPMAGIVLCRFVHRPWGAEAAHAALICPFIGIGLSDERAGTVICLHCQPGGGDPQLPGTKWPRPSDHVSVRFRYITAVGQCEKHATKLGCGISPPARFDTDRWGF